MPDYKFTAYFRDADGNGLASLTVTANIRNNETGASVETGITPTNVGDGAYSVYRDLPEADYICFFKTAADGHEASLGILEVTRIDAATSTRATNAGVWDYLTSAMTTVGSIGKRIVDLLDIAVSTRLAAADYVAPSVPLVGYRLVKSDVDFDLYRGDTNTVPFRLGTITNYSNIIITMKSGDDEDADAVLQADLSNGLLVLNGSNNVTPADSLITVVDEVTGRIDWKLEFGSSKELPVKVLDYDVQVIYPTKVETPQWGKASVLKDVTRRTS